MHKTLAAVWLAIALTQAATDAAAQFPPPLASQPSGGPVRNARYVIDATRVGHMSPTLESARSAGDDELIPR